MFSLEGHLAHYAQSAESLCQASLTCVALYQLGGYFDMPGMQDKGHEAFEQSLDLIVSEILKQTKDAAETGKKATWLESVLPLEQRVYDDDGTEITMKGKLRETMVSWAILHAETILDLPDFRIIRVGVPHFADDILSALLKRGHVPDVVCCCCSEPRYDNTTKYHLPKETWQSWLFFKPLYAMNGNWKEGVYCGFCMHKLMDPECDRCSCS
jgi:hypothetical protein